MAQGWRARRRAWRGGGCAVVSSRRRARAHPVARPVTRAVAANRGEQAKNNQKMWRVLAERKAAVKKEMRARELAKEL